MSPNNRYQAFIKELKRSLPTSSALERKKWASTIIHEKFRIRSLSDLLLLDHKTASRFLWLLTDIGELDNQVLKKELVFLFERCSSLNHIKIEPSFANYWLICGVPEEKEAEYIDLLFKWLRSSESNITTKSRSLFVLYRLTKKHPEMYYELKSILQEELNRNTNSFEKRATKILIQLERDFV